MRHALALAAALSASLALAERGVFIASAQAGQVLSVAPSPGADRAVPIVGTIAYGLSERWSMGGSFHVELSNATALGLSAGPRLTLFKSTWWGIEALLAPEAAWLPAATRFQLGARVGLSVRYLLLWGLGVTLEAGVRGRADAVGPFAPVLQGYVIGGLYCEA